MRLGCTGHRELDTSTTLLVTDALRHILNPHNPTDLVGMSCLADGADQIFAAEVLNAGGDLEVIVPAEQYRDGLPAVAHAAYDDLLSQARHIHRLGHQKSTSDAHMDASLYMLDHIDALLAVWDGKPARGFGGTADVVAAAEERDMPITVVWPPGAHR